MLTHEIIKGAMYFEEHQSNNYYTPADGKIIVIAY